MQKSHWNAIHSPSVWIFSRNHSGTCWTWRSSATYGPITVYVGVHYRNDVSDVKCSIIFFAIHRCHRWQGAGVNVNLTWLKLSWISLLTSADFPTFESPTRTTLQVSKSISGSVGRWGLWWWRMLSLFWLPPCLPWIPICVDNDSWYYFEVLFRTLVYFFYFEVLNFMREMAAHMHIKLYRVVALYSCSTISQTLKYSSREEIQKSTEVHRPQQSRACVARVRVFVWSSWLNKCALCMYSRGAVAFLIKSNGVSQCFLDKSRIYKCYIQSTLVKEIKP